MKKMMLLMLTLFFLGAVSMNAQVNIGSVDGPTPGTVLDLSKSGKQLGLRLPVVSLSGATPFQLTDGGDGSLAAGTVVYNDGKGALTAAGIYVWDGAKWLVATLGTVPCPTPAQPTITGKNGNAGNEVYTNDTNLTYSVASPESDVTYTWSSSDFTLPSTKTGTSIVVTAPATTGTKNITVTPSNSCGNGTARTLAVTVTAKPTNPTGTIVIPNAKTGFISGAYTSVPTTTKSGSLLLAASDGNSGNTKAWNSISGYNSTSYVNDNAGKFVGANAGCAAGWRLPSIVELKAIADYLKATYGSYTGTTGNPAGFTALQAFFYWSSTYYGPYNESNGTAWVVHFSNGNTNGSTDAMYYVRCVRDL